MIPAGLKFDEAFEAIFGSKPPADRKPADLPELTDEQLFEGDLTEQRR